MVASQSNGVVAEEAKEVPSPTIRTISVAESDSKTAKKKKGPQFFRDDIKRGIIPLNNSPIKVRCLKGENTDAFSPRLPNKHIPLGYNSFYKNENYHIIHNRGPNNLHEMAVEVND